MTKNDTEQDSTVPNTDDTLNKNTAKSENTAKDEDSDSIRSDDTKADKNDGKNTKKLPKNVILKNKLTKIVSKDSNLSLIKVIGTALTAISMALISAKLAGFVNSIILIGLASIGTALLSEFYRVILSVTTMGAKKVVEPVLKLDTKTGEMKIVEKTDDSDLLSEPSTDDSSINAEPLTKKPLIYRLKNTFKRNPFLRFSLLFGAVSIMTITSAYFISSENQSTQSNYTTVYKTEKENISETDKQKIIETAVDEANKDDGTQNTSTNRDTTATVPVDAPTQTSAPSSTATDNSNLEARLDKLETENSTLRDEVNTLKNGSTTTQAPNVPVTTNDSTEINDLNTKINNQQTVIDNLTKEMNDMKKQLNNTAQTQPSTNPTPQPTENVQNNTQNNAG